ncbi:ATP-binding cassette domain-containing protein [Cellulomonas sp. S1-8]|uniref:ATP-binding cassette domain-containing protein n=1 Tax=Cellulomonas sp. S1-8 TaxID=2904790 RepID=UPI0022445CE0|nr:ATP-binding cassette domain-containing protein [Cellulomonas sp. S1-8]UZN05086.1 ATP-binding cassette domain-containing protein [Cellulomonas sp. S1-8]
MTLDVRVRVDRGAFRLDVAVRVPPGTVLAVMGPNGSGKSTLLEAVAGLVPLTGGHVRLGDDVLADAATGWHLPPRDRRLGVALQDGLLFGHLSARENVAFGPRAQGVRAAHARATADALLVEVGLEAHGRTRGDRLSGGQAQRVAVARAVAAVPRALLLDEPFAALDAATRGRVRDVVRRVVATGVPAIVVTHDLRDAVDLADQLLVLEEGHEVQRGAPADVAAAPGSPYVARAAAGAA